MSTSGTNPPPVCKIKLVLVVNPESPAPENCTTVSSPFMYVVLSENPNNDQSATVSWTGVQIPLQALPDNNLILRGATTQENAPETVTLKFDGFDPTSEPCSTGTCVPEGC